MIKAKNTFCTLYKGVAIDNSYEHTLHFRNKEHQETYFTTSEDITSRITYTNLNYQRIYSGEIKLNGDYDAVRSHNYLTINNNDGLGNYYCFVKNIEYIDTNTFKVIYEIDVIQTYFFEFKLEQVMVEREHTYDDPYCKYIEPEIFDETKYCITSVTPLTRSITYDVELSTGNKDNPDETAFYRKNIKWFMLIWIVDNKDYDYTYYYNHNFNGAVCIAVPLIPEAGVHVQALLKQVKQGGGIKTFNFPDQGRITLYEQTFKAGSFVSGMYLCPAEMIYTYNTDTDGSDIYLGEESYDIQLPTQFVNTYTSVRYTPSNYKLYNYPYCYVELTNNEGITKDYYWENSDLSYNGKPIIRFNVNGTFNPTPELYCYPKNYLKESDCFDHGITKFQYPVGSWSEDSFSEWWRVNRESFELKQNRNVYNTALSTVQGGISTARSVDKNDIYGFASSITGIAQSIGNGIYNSLELTAQKNAKKLESDKLSGGSSNSMISTLVGRNQFEAKVKMIDSRTMLIIDSFLSAYGYAMNKIKKPVLYTYDYDSLRPSWNYLKTENSYILPMENTNIRYNNNEKKLIEAVFNKGITFWKDKGNSGMKIKVGYYNQENPPYERR